MFGKGFHGVKLCWTSAGVMHGSFRQIVYASGPRGEHVEPPTFRQQSQAVFAWTLGRPRDLPGKHKRLAKLTCIARRRAILYVLYVSETLQIIRVLHY